MTVLYYRGLHEMLTTECTDPKVMSRSSPPLNALLVLAGDDWKCSIYIQGHNIIPTFSLLNTSKPSLRSAPIKYHTTNKTIIAAPT